MTITLITITITLTAIFFTIAERKLLASIQRRKGPNVTGSLKNIFLSKFCIASFFVIGHILFATVYQHPDIIIIIIILFDFLCAATLLSLLWETVKERFLYYYSISPLFQVWTHNGILENCISISFRLVVPISSIVFLSSYLLFDADFNIFQYHAYAIGDDNFVPQSQSVSKIHRVENDTKNINVNYSESKNEAFIPSKKPSVIHSSPKAINYPEEYHYNRPCFTKPPIKSTSYTPDYSIKPNPMTEQQPAHFECKEETKQPKLDILSNTTTDFINSSSMVKAGEYGKIRVGLHHALTAVRSHNSLELVLSNDTNTVFAEIYNDPIKRLQLLIAIEEIMEINLNKVNSESTTTKFNQILNLHSPAASEILKKYNKQDLINISNNMSSAKTEISKVVNSSIVVEPSKFLHTISFCGKAIYTYATMEKAFNTVIGCS